MSPDVKSQQERLPWNNFFVPADVKQMLDKAPSVIVPESREEQLKYVFGEDGSDVFEVSYDVPGKGKVVEATVTRCRNGASVNYVESYMRRRDPECMVVADDIPSEKTRFSDRFSGSFKDWRKEILAWLSEQDLMLLPFKAGNNKFGYDSLLIAPKNAAFFVTGLADLQGIATLEDAPQSFSPRAILFLAPPFRHTHCDGKQVVIHHREQGLHEIFSLNLYPGPSAKKGVYGVLLSIGETEGWITAHGATVQVVTPYDNIVTIMHEGASGGGKSEMLENPHREKNGRLLLGRNNLNGEVRMLSISQTCELRPVTDDMALCHPKLQENSPKLVVLDAEEAWFLRFNHITHYGVDPSYERMTIHPDEPLIFLNMDGKPNSTCLIWEHIHDKPGVPCPNPRVIMPRRLVDNIVNEPVTVDIRSFGIRAPICTREKPTYGIFGLLHYLPPALAWLWRLVAPRGHGNPSITDTLGMTSEGVGSYWPFATGRRVDQANLLLSQIVETPGTRYTLSPNQNVGAWEVSFMPQWLAREYLARRGGAKFRPEQLSPARCSLLGYSLNSMIVEGYSIPPFFLQVEKQSEVGEDGYDAGAEILFNFFKEQLKPFLADKDLNPLGKKIIEACLDKATVEQFAEFIAHP